MEDHKKIDAHPLEMTASFAQKQALLKHQQEVGLDDQEFKEMENFIAKGQADSFSGTYQSCLSCCGSCCKCCFVPCYFCGCGAHVIVQQGSVGLVTEFGRYKRKVPPGLYVINSCTEQYQIVDLKTQVDNISAQSLLTSDSVSIRIDAVVYYLIKDPFKAIFRVANGNYKKAIDNIIQGSLKNIIGENRLQQLLDDRKAVDKRLSEIVDRKTDAYGIKVFTVETTEIYLPQSMQRAMATVAETLKEKEAKVIDAEGQLQASSILKQAADEMTKNPASLQLMYFEVLKAIAVERNNTIIVPEQLLSFASKIGNK
jgi:regulator of protease activity HflC (stomatin/prohibitin superfamily)